MPALTQDELKKSMNDRLELMRESGYRFDLGKQIEASTLAISIRILVHDGSGSSTSLLTHLGLKSQLFLDFARQNTVSKNTFSLAWISLTSNLLDNSKHKYAPNLDNLSSFREVSFDEWWNSIVVTTFDSTTFTRKEIALYVADKDNGAHVDANLPEKYYKLNSLNGMETFIIKSKNPINKLPDKLPIEEMIPSSSPVPYIIRQIAHELLRLLDQNYAPNPHCYDGTGFTDFSISY